MLRLQHHDPMPDIIPAGRPIVKSPFDSVSESLSTNKAASSDSKSPFHHRHEPDRNQQRFGVQSDKNSDNCFDLMHNLELSDIGQYFMDKKESIYRSRQKRPLGHATSGGSDFPEKVRDPDFLYGLASEGGESIDRILFPDEGAILYRKTDPEQLEIDRNQRQKRLIWGLSNIDPKSYRFGAPAAGTNDTAADLLAPKRSLLIGMRRREDHKAAHQHVVGRSTRLTKATSELTGQAFGLPSRAENDEQNWGAKECLSGYSLSQEISESAKTKPNCCDMIAAGTSSIQTNRKPPRIRSLANTINYGDCPRAHELLYPPKFSSSGIMDDDFTGQRHLHDLRQLFDGAGMMVSDDEFMQIKEKLGSSSHSNILSYQKAYNQVKAIILTNK